MRYMFHVIFLLIIACLQGTACNTFAIAGVSVNLFIIYVSIISFLADKKEGIIIAGAYGLVLDILVERFVGTYTVLFVIVAFFVYNMAKRVFKEPKYYICALVVLVASLFVNVFYYLIVFGILQSIDIGYAIFKIILPEAVLDCVVSVPVYFLIRHVTKNFYNDKGEFIG